MYVVATRVASLPQCLVKVLGLLARMRHPHDPPIRRDPSDEHPTVGVRERNSGLLHAGLRHALLELDVLPLPRKRSRELLQGENHRDVTQPRRMEQGI